jgi:hypothetical protein
MQAKLLISIGKVAFFDVSFTDSGLNTLAHAAEHQRKQGWQGSLRWRVKALG